MSMPDCSSGSHMFRTMSGHLEGPDRGRSPGPHGSGLIVNQSMSNHNSYSPSRPPTSAEIDAVIAAAMANAPPAPSASQPDLAPEPMPRPITPLMTNLLPAAVGVDGRVNLFVGNLPYRVRWQDLKDLFRKAGTVLRADVSLGPDNRSRGYGTVLLGSREDAARAIDRFNGYTWQTRTLEVRPDRLPPEYEPQPQQLHHAVPPRPPIYTYHNMSGGGHSAFTLPGHLLPSNGPAWLPGQLPMQRPPMNTQHGAAANSQSMMGVMSLPGMSLSPHPPHMAPAGSSPLQSGPSSSSVNGNGGLPLPLSRQNTGNHIYHPIGASPLAGSLSFGTVPAPLPGYDNVRRDSLTPFDHSIPQEGAGLQPRSTSPSDNIITSQSRPSSSSRRPPRSNSPPRDMDHTDRPAQTHGTLSGHLGTIPSPLFLSLKSSASLTDSGYGRRQSAGSSGSPPDGHRLPAGPPIQMPMGMEGLAHQGSGLGPPSTLHDRVVFVSNLPLTMQWQELKDLLRPAGVIIRADVATDPDGRPRGFGTALFATESDALKAVAMYNERDLGGRRIRVHLERDSHYDSHGRRPSDQLSNGFRASPPLHNGHWQPAYPQLNGPPPAPSMTHQERPPGDIPSPHSARLPWALNTSLSGLQTTPAREPASVHGFDCSPHLSFRQMHHPGPISMPPFPSLENGNPLSPLQLRGLPPMTPSMPGFVFNAYPETPPIHAHFLSPGLGPFSPGIPVTSPTGFAYNPFLNPAPGAPVNRYPQGGSAQLGTPTTQVFPNNPIRGYAGAPGPPVITQTLSGVGHEYFPTQPFGSTRDPQSPSPADRPLTNGSAIHGKDRVGSSQPDDDDRLPALAASMSLNGTRNRTPPTSTSLAVRPQKSASGLDLADLARGEALAGRASMDGQRPVLDPGWTGSGERRASFGDIGSGK